MKVFLIGIVTIFAICLLVTTHAGSLRPHGKYHERLIQEEKEQLKSQEDIYAEESIYKKFKCRIYSFFSSPYTND